MTTRIRNKYARIAIVIMLMAMIYLVVGLSDFNLAILAGDIGFIVTAVFFVPEIKKVMRTRESKELLRLESPLNWLKSMTTFFVLSLLSSFVYGFANVPNVGVEFNLIIQYLFIFCVIFFLFGLLYTVRIIWFIIDPASKTNILAGKVMKTIVASGTKILVGNFPSEEIPLYYILLDRIDVNGEKLRFVEPITANVIYQDKAYYCRNEDLGIVSMSDKYEDCIKDFHEEILFLWKEYGKEDDNKLTNDAKELKRKFLRYIGK